MKKAKTIKKLSETGRPLGSTIYGEEEFVKKAKAAYKGFLKRNKNPGREDIARKLGISRATFYRYLAKYTSWTDIRDDA